MEMNQAIALVERNPNLKLLHKLVPRDFFSPDDGSEKIKLMILDSETTGLDKATDVVIELGYIIVEFSVATGKFYRVLKRFNALQDPGFPLSDEVKRVNNISDEDLKGKKFPHDEVNQDIKNVDCVLAHNSGFDREMVEKEFPDFSTRPWICSLVHGPWDSMGFSTKKLDYLCVFIGGFFFEAHRAINDVEATMELISLPAHDGNTIISHIYDRGNDPVFVVWATNSPFETKDILSKRKYKWHDKERNGNPKAWYKQNIVDLDEELEFLANEIYPRGGRVRVDLIFPVDAFTTRYTESKSQSF